MKNHKSIVILITVILLVVGCCSIGVFAADSISQKDLEPYVSEPDASRTQITEADTTKYSSEDVQSLVTDLKNGEEITPSEIVDRMIENQPEGKEDSEAFPTTTGETINLKLYDQITDVKDLTNIDGTLDGDPGTVVLVVPETIGMKGEDLLIMQFDPKTGEIYLIVLSAFDPETGEMMVTFPVYGPFMVIGKIRLVDKIITPDLYPNQVVADMIRPLKKDDYLSLKEFLNAQGMTSGKLTFTVDENGEGELVASENSGHVVYASDEKEEEKTREISVNVNNYMGVTYITDLVVRVGVDEFGYNLNTKIKARLYQDMDRANWTRILNYAGVKYKLEEVKKNPQILMDLEPFVLKGCFVYHIDATTGEVSIIYEPTISFDTYGEEIEGEIQTNDKQDTGEETTSRIDLDEIFGHKVYAEMRTINKDDITWHYADDIDENNEANLNMVVSGNGVLGLGPWILFVPKNNGTISGTPWWIWLILGALAAGGAGYVVYNKKKQKEVDVQ